MAKDGGFTRFVKEVWQEIVHKVEQGAHEFASLLYRGDAFVLYGNGEKENNNKASVSHAPRTDDQSLQYALQQEPAKQEDQQVQLSQETQQQKRGGMSL